jgi:hypothetical protein
MNSMFHLTQSVFLKTASPTFAPSKMLWKKPSTRSWPKTKGSATVPPVTVMPRWRALADHVGPPRGLRAEPLSR